MMSLSVVASLVRYLPMLPRYGQSSAANSDADDGDAPADDDGGDYNRKLVRWLEALKETLPRAHPCAGEEGVVATHSLGEADDSAALVDLLMMHPVDATACISYVRGLSQFIDAMARTAPLPSAEATQGPGGASTFNGYPFQQPQPAALCRASAYLAEFHWSLYARFQRHAGAHRHRHRHRRPPVPRLLFLLPTAMQVLANFVRACRPRSYAAFFSDEERQLLVVACTLIAWKQLDSDASGHLLVKCACSSCNSGATHVSSFPYYGSSLPSSTAPDSYSYFLVVRSSSYMTAGRLQAMERYVLETLRFRVRCIPLWWRVCVDLVADRHYYRNIRGTRLHDALRRQLLSGGADTTTTTTIETLREEGSAGLDAALCGYERALLLVRNAHASVLMLLMHCKTASTAVLQEVLAHSPLMGVVLAVACDAVPLEWVAQQLSGARGGEGEGDEPLQWHRAWLSGELRRLCALMDACCNTPMKKG